MSNNHYGGCMKLLATIALFAFAIVGSDVLADAKPGGIARQVAMGGSQAGPNLILNPFIMDDPALMFMNPAYQAMYKDYAWMNIAGGTLTGLSTVDNGYGHQNAGVSFALDREWTLGAILSYDPSFANGVSQLLSGSPSPGGGLPSLPPFITSRSPQSMPFIGNVWEVLGSYDGGNMDIGFGVTYGSASSETKASVTTPVAGSSESEVSARMFGFRGGINYDMGGGSSFDLSAALRLDNATDDITSSAGSGGEYSVSGTEIQVQARGKFKVSNKLNFVPYALFSTLSADPKEDAFPTGGSATVLKEEISATAIAVGVGGEYRTPDFYLAGGVSFQYAKAKIDTAMGGPGLKGELTYTALPVFNIGGEWWFTDWLAGRGGYYRALASIKAKAESGGSTTEATITLPHSFLLISGLTPATYDGLVTLGLGFRFGNFSLDATVSEEALRRGLGLIGATDNINTFGYMTASFNFE